MSEHDSTASPWPPGGSEQKCAQEATRESEERFRALTGLVPALLWQTDPSGHVVAFNQRWLEYTGQTLQETQGQSWLAVIHPDDRENTARVFAEAYEMQQPVELQHRVRRRDGQYRWFLIRQLPLRDEQGRVARWLGAATDIHAQRTAMDALRESEERFRQFAEASSDVVWIRDARTLAMEYVNPAFETIYGADRVAVLDDSDPEHWAELIHPEDRAAALEAIRRVIEGEARTHEFRIVRPADGRVRWIQDTDFPLRDVQGRLQRFGGFAKDVTEAKELSDRLQVLVAELQHRTRNLLGVVRSVSDRTLADSASLDTFQERFRRRLDALARVNGLLSRLNGGDRIAFDELVRAELSAHGAVDEAGHGPRVSLEGPRGVPLRSATVQTFALALHELATNALKYGALSRPEGRLQVRWKVVAGEDGEPCLRVEWVESGVPLPGDGQPRLGFGRELIERALPYQLKAQTSYEIGPDGVRCTITLPVSARYAGIG